MAGKPGKGGPPKGSKNAATSAVLNPFKSSINRLCAQEDYKRVHAAADEVLTQASKGERWAVELLRDTTDGKPAQAINAEIHGSLTVEVVRFADTSPG